MDTIAIRVAGYEYALRTPPEHDTDIMIAYERLCGGSYLDDGFRYFEWGVNDVAIQADPLLSLADVARMSGMSQQYLRAEAKAGRLQPEGVGKNRRISYNQYREWMHASVRRGSRSKQAEQVKDGKR